MDKHLRFLWINWHKIPHLQWTSTDADSKATRAAIQAEPAKILCICINQPLSPRLDTETDILLRLPPPHVHPPCLCLQTWCKVIVTLLIHIYIYIYLSETKSFINSRKKIQQLEDLLKHKTNINKTKIPEKQSQSQNKTYEAITKSNPSPQQLHCGVSPRIDFIC